MQTIWLHCEKGLKAEGKSSILFSALRILTISVGDLLKFPRESIRFLTYSPYMLTRSRLTLFWMRSVFPQPHVNFSVAKVTAIKPVEKPGAKKPKHGERNVNIFQISSLKIAVINSNRVHRQLIWRPLASQELKRFRYLHERGLARYKMPVGESGVERLSHTCNAR